MKKLLLSLFAIGVGALGYSQGETCATAMDVTPGAYTANGPATGAGAEDPCALGGATNADWYSYTADVDQSITVASCLGGFDTRVSISTGDCGALTCVGSNDDACLMEEGGANAYASSLTVNVTAGSTYLIEWDDRWSTDAFDWELTTGDFLLPPDCPTLITPMDGATDVTVFGDADTVSFEWSAATTGGAVDGYQIWFGTDSTALNNLGTLGGGSTGVDIFGITFLTTYYWQLIPINSEGEGMDCEMFSFTSMQSSNDTDGDGVDDEFDCAPEDILVYAGATCDDGLATTLGDVIQEDCSCAGQPIIECGTTWFDAGGAEAEYGINENYTETMCPDVDGETVTVTFASFATEAGFDFLEVFNGSSTDAESMGSFSGSDPIGPFLATNESGCLTFQFTSDGSIVDAGWEANVSCALPPACFAPTNISTDSLTIDGAQIAWLENGDATTWMVEIVMAGEAPTGVGMTTTENPYTATGLTDFTMYDVYVMADCGDDLTSEWVGPTSFTTLALPPANDMCAGATMLTIGTECVADTTANNFGATDSGITPGCANYGGGDVWFSFVAPASGSVTIELSGVAGGITDSGMALYEGTCDALELVDCNDDTNGLFSAISATELVEGTTYFVAAWEYGGDTEGFFGICAYETPDTDCSVYTGGPWVDFNTTFGGAPVADGDGVCPVNQLDAFEVWANEAYTVDGFVEGTEYTFTMCDGPGAGAWAPELVIMDTLFNVIEGPIEDCTITWTAGAMGTYLIGINEAGVCGPESTNLGVNNGYPTLTCTGADVLCSTYTGGPWIDFNSTFGGAPVADAGTGICPFNEIQTFEIWANEAYSVDGFVAGETYTFSMDNGPGAGSWAPELTVMDVDFNIIEGPVSATSITWECAADGTYLIGINESGVCGPESTNLDVDNGFPALTCEGSVSIEEVENSLNISVYPNPANNELNFNVNGLSVNKSVVSIYSLQGQLVQSNELNLSNGNVETMDISNIANGVYMLQISNGAAIQTRRIIIE